MTLARAVPPSPPRRSRRAAWADAFRSVRGWFPLTPTGVLALASVWGLHRWLAVGQADRVVQALTLLAGAIIALCVVTVVVAGVAMARVRSPAAGESLELLAGSAFRTEFSLGPWSWVPLLSFRLAWEAPRGVVATLASDGLGVCEEVVPSRRGQSAEIVRRIQVEDVFGMARVHFRRRQPQDLTILPAVSAATELAPFLQFRTGDGEPVPAGRPEGDRVEFRPYAPGDPLRLVLWKIFARSGQLFVRTPERTLSPHERTLVYFVAGEGDEASASVARTALERSAFGTDFLFQADGADAATRDPGEAVMQLVRSSTAAAPAAGLRDLLAGEEGPGGARCILFGPSQPGRWLDAVAERVAGRAVTMLAVIGVDQLGPETTPSWIQWLLFGRVAEARGRHAEVRAVIDGLARLGASVRVVERGTGRLVEPARVPRGEVAHAALV